MLRFKESPAGCMLYFMLSIVVNFLVFILRISAHEIIPHNTTTTITTTSNSASTLAVAAAAAAIGIGKTATTTTTETDSEMSAYNIINPNGTGFEPPPPLPPPLPPYLSIGNDGQWNVENLTAIKSAALIAPPANQMQSSKDDASYDNNISSNNGISSVAESATNAATIILMSSRTPSSAVVSEWQSAVETTTTIAKITATTTIVRQELSAPTIRTTAPLKKASKFVARNLLLQNSRAAIKSLSPSATANNNTMPAKSHKTDAPMLNYIFDSHLATNKHHHLDRYGPHFDDIHSGEKMANVTAQLGSVAYLNCRIRLLQDKTVSWMKREQDDKHLQLLTVGTHTYSADSRFSVEFEFPNNWRLRIADTNKSDEGVYECQISTHPPRAILTRFRVQAPEVFIIDEHKQPLVDKYYEVDSTIELLCIVRHVSMVSSAVYWLHGNRMLNFDMTRGGISVKTDLMENGANSTLFIAKVRKTDTGNYTCSIGPNDSYTINVHVLNGESLAELYHGGADALLYEAAQCQNWIGFAIVHTIFICVVNTLLASQMNFLYC